jgi:hypothetical protein
MVFELKNNGNTSNGSIVAQYIPFNIVYINWLVNLIKSYEDKFLMTIIEIEPFMHHLYPQIPVQVYYFKHYNQGNCVGNEAEQE